MLNSRGARVAYPLVVSRYISVLAAWLHVHCITAMLVPLALTDGHSVRGAIRDSFQK